MTLTATSPQLQQVDLEQIRGWYRGLDGLERLRRGGLGRRVPDEHFLADELEVPPHVAFLVQQAPELDLETLASIPFYSLCRGLLLPLSGLTPERSAVFFGLRAPAPPSSAEREEVLRRFLQRDLGLTQLQKLACLLGDPFEGKPPRLRRDSLLRLLQSEALVTRRELLDQLTLVGDVAVLFARSRSALKAEPQLTAAEVLETLRRLPDARRSVQFELLRSLLERCGKLEAYFLARLMEKRAGLRYESELLARLVAEQFDVEPEAVSHAMALTDAFHVVRLLQQDGVDGLRSIQLQPLVPVRPALAGGEVKGSGASGGTESIKRFPTWVERKYDGIRMMLHKTTDALGSVLCGAYSRNRRDYLELVRGLDAVIKTLPVRSAIVDGELYGTIVDLHGARPAQVYELFSVIQGDLSRPVQLRYAAFDLLYLDGHDLTGRPLSERRQYLSNLIAPLAASSWLPVPVTLAEGQMASSGDDVKRLYQHFRAQGYEGIISKDLDAPYRLASRDPSWLKKKPEITVDLVLLGAVLAVTTKEKAGMFGSYIIAARSAEVGFLDVGDVAGVDRERDAQIQQLIMSEGLLTGQRIERKGAGGVRPGFELMPHIVVTVRFDGIVKDQVTGVLSLRDPKLVVIRPDKTAFEADTVESLEQLFLRERMG